MSSNAPTIYALASATGKAGVAVFRISGPQASAVLPFLGVSEKLNPREARLVRLSYQGNPLDTALALHFPAPHSFTGDDVVELHTHGSRAVTRLLLEALGACPGLRLAEPGEFARRAFLNEKLDLAQAEALADLIDADTKTQHAQAMRQLSGDMSARITALRGKILTPLALLEAYIDFPDEEIPQNVLDETSLQVDALMKEIRGLLDDGGMGEKIRSGLEIVIFGPPNAGKSSLMNALARRDVAIVSDEAGTTRDLIEVHLELDGYAATLIDTAGLRDGGGAVEKEGIKRAKNRIENADIRLAVVNSVSFQEQLSQIAADMHDDTIIIANKTDLFFDQNIAQFALPISVRTGAGLEELVETLKAKVHEKMDGAPSPLITQARHREAMEEALDALARFSVKNPLELACEELRTAARALGKITGKILVDDVLDLVFSRFCIGK